LPSWLYVARPGGAIPFRARRRPDPALLSFRTRWYSVRVLDGFLPSEY
jgi:hypothetical protein